MWTRGRFNDEYVPGLFAVAIDSYVNRRARSLWKQLATVKTSGKKKEESGERSGLGLPVVKGEGAQVSYDTEIAGPKQTWIHKVYALAVRITEEAIEDNLYELNGGGNGDELKEIFHDLGESMEENIETKMARFFNNGTATTYHQTRETTAAALFANAHVRLDASTYDNYTTSSDLTYQTFWSNLVSAENQYNHRQFKIARKVQKLWVPPEKERQGREVLFSPDRPDTANRAINAYIQSGRNVKLLVWPYITDVDMWVLQTEGNGIIFFWRRKTRFARERDFQTGDMQCKSDQRWSAEIEDARCFLGNVPA